MNVPVLSSPSSGAPAAARDRETRRVRILALVQAGWSYAAIGREDARGEAEASEDSPSGDATLDAS